MRDELAQRSGGEFARRAAERRRGGERERRLARRNARRLVDKTTVPSRRHLRPALVPDLSEENRQLERVLERHVLELVGGHARPLVVAVADRAGEAALR
jgi:hypothetical protein